MNESADSLSLNRLLERSEEFERAIVARFPEGWLTSVGDDQKHEHVVSACLLCIEHANVLRAAFGMEAPNSGSALLRLQFEALLRAAWLLYAATPTQVEQLDRTLDTEAEHAANKHPGIGIMLEAVKKEAPHGLSAHLVEFDLYSRRALNSFVHSGIHALRRVRDGYPIGQAATLVRFSNALMHFAYRMLASVTGSQLLMNEVTHAYTNFKDCVPMANGPSTKP